jgi:hypothetical protein
VEFLVEAADGRKFRLVPSSDFQVSLTPDVQAKLAAWMR